MDYAEARRDVRCGSGSVLRRHRLEGLFLGVEPTNSGYKRTSALECRLLGDKQTYFGLAPNVDS